MDKLNDKDKNNEKEIRRELEKERRRRGEKERRREGGEREGEKKRRREGEKERRRKGEKERRREGEEKRRRPRPIHACVSWRPFSVRCKTRIQPRTTSRPNNKQAECTSRSELGLGLARNVRIGVRVSS